jgi:hypothetical protein
VSALPLAFAPLPTDASPGAAWNDQLTVNSPFVATRLEFLVPGEYYFYPLSLIALLTTDATAITREGLFYILDGNGAVVIQQPVTGTQAPSKQFVYNFNISTGAGYSDGLANFAAPLPPRLLGPGFRTGFQVNGVQAGDTGFATLSVIKVPRARPVVMEPVLIPTPFIV